jgi:DNA-nicking Smr family endonuclease
MTRSETEQIVATRQRLVAAAKGTAPLSRRVAAQMVEDLTQWHRWQSWEWELPRLPRRIRLGLAPRSTAHSARKSDFSADSSDKLNEGSKNKNTRNAQNPGGIGTKQMERLSIQQQLDLLAADQSRCLGIAVALLQRGQTANDLLSECMESAVGQIMAGKVRAGNVAQFYAWLHQIVRFSCYRFLKRQKSEVEFEEANTEEARADFGCQDFDHARTWGRSKRCADADSQ